LRIGITFSDVVAGQVDLVASNGTGVLQGGVLTALAVDVQASGCLNDAVGLGFV